MIEARSLLESSFHHEYEPLDPIRAHTVANKCPNLPVRINTRLWESDGMKGIERVRFGENIKQCKRKISDGHYTAAIRVLSSSGVAPYSDATLEDLKTNHPFKPAPSLPHIPFDHHHIIASQSVVLDIIKSFPRGTSCGQDGLWAQHLIDCLSGSVVAISDELVSSITHVVNLFFDGSCPKMLGEYIASAPLTPLVKTVGGIHPIVVGTAWRRLVSKLVMKRVAKTIGLMDVVAKINDPQYELLLLRSSSGPGFSDWQWRLATLPFAFEGLGVYSAGDVLNYAFLASRLQDIYGDHAVSCAGIVGIKHHHNVVRDTLFDICYRSRISAGKEVDIGLDGGRDKPLCLADMLLYPWDEGLDVCVDLTGSSPLTQTEMTDFVPGRAVIDAAQRKCGKYMDKCAAIGYGFLPVSFSSIWELEADAVSLLKRIIKFSMTQDIGARTTVYIFNRISFSIVKGVVAQIVSRLPSNLL
nr:hypothetical protein [Tanacetum cinerariifolium]